LSYGELPSFLASLRTREAIAARALELLILTAARTGEVIGVPALTIDFGAASAQIARVLDPEVYSLCIESARVLQKNQNTLVALELIEVEGGAHVATQPIWVDGPNANAGRLAAENRHLIAQLLALAGKPTAGNVHALIPELAGLTFEAQLVVAVDSRTGRSFNAIATIFTDGGA
jgi:hypothetical protein